MILQRYENLKQISSESTNQDNFLVILAGIGFCITLKKLTQPFQVSMHVHPYQPLQKATGNSFNV